MKTILKESYIGQKQIWKGSYLGNTIEVHNSWFNGKVLINNVVQKVNYGWFGKSIITSSIFNQNSNVIFKMKLVAGFLDVKCYLFVGDQEIKMVRV